MAVEYKKINNFLKFLLVLFLFPVFCGCSTLTYVGDDYNVNNVQTIKTNEDFVFDVYKKTDENVNIKMGISKTPIMEILALYVQVENLSYEIPYVFKVNDLNVASNNEQIQFITTANYLNIFQTQEASSMSAMSSFSPTLQNMTGMMNNYNEINQQMIQNANSQANNSAFSRLETLGNQISNHSIKYSSTVSPRKSQYYYFFFENPDEEILNVKYKNLNYQFKL